MKNKVNEIKAKVFDVPIESVNENCSPEEIEKWDLLFLIILDCLLIYATQDQSLVHNE